MTEPKEVWEVRAETIYKFYDQDGNRIPMGCCGQNKVPPPPPPAEEPEPEPDPEQNPPPGVPEDPVPPGTEMPPDDLPEEEPPPAPEPPPEEPPEPDPPPPDDPVPPGDPFPEPPPPSDPVIPEPPPESNEFTRVLGDVGNPYIAFADIVVPDGESWRFKNVEIKGNIRTTGGTVAMRAGDRIKFFDADVNAYVGGGIGYESQFAQDYGIWIGIHGKLDVRGTPKLGWNRLGTHETWVASDEYYIMPTEPGDLEVHSWNFGDPVPQVHSTLPPTEVVNVTRDVVIEGPAHIHVHSHEVQRIEYVRLEKMGVSNEASRGPVLGRYALHLHHGFDGSAGTIVRGVAAVNCGGKVFVPHLSHGITFIDCVSINSTSDGFWWDRGDVTNDLLIDRCLVGGVDAPWFNNPERPVVGYFLGAGTNMEIRNSVACCVRGTNGTGFFWADPGPEFEATGAQDLLVWIFNLNNVAHNNEIAGIGFWTNLPHPHTVENNITYRNAGFGIGNGAYQNAVRYNNCYCFEDGTSWANSDQTVEKCGVFWSSNPGVTVPGGLPPALRNSVIVAKTGAAFRLGHRVLEAQVGVLFLMENCTLTPGPGKKKIELGDCAEPWKAQILNCNVTPDDIEFIPEFIDANEGTHIEIRGGATEWDVDVTNGEVVVTVIP